MKSTVKFDHEASAIYVDGDLLSHEHGKKFKDFNVPMTWGDTSEGTKQTACVFAVHYEVPRIFWKDIFKALSKVPVQSGVLIFDTESFTFTPEPKEAPVKNDRSKKDKSASDE